MKEFPKFDYNGKSYDLNFYDDSVNLYGVVNKLSGVMVSQLIPAANDYVAITGFCDFLAKQKEKNDNEIYDLYRLGILNLDKVQISDNEKTILLDSRDDVAKWLEDSKMFMLSWSEEE